MKPRPTLAELEALAGELQANHAHQMNYWNREAMPPERLMARGRKLRHQIAQAILPLMETLCSADALSVAVFPADGSKYSLSYDPDSVCVNGGLQINCTQTAADVEFERQCQAEKTTSN